VIERPVIPDSAPGREATEFVREASTPLGMVCPAEFESEAGQVHPVLLSARSEAAGAAAGMLLSR
jgi:hypothetical protein